MSPEGRAGRSLRVVLLAAGLVASSANATLEDATPEAGQTRASYERAVRASSTSTAYVRVTLVDAGTGSRRLTCVDPNLLRGALMRAGANETQALRQVLDSPDRVFRVRDPQAAFGSAATITDDDLDRARAAFAAYTEDELCAAFRPSHGGHGPARAAAQDVPQAARACALVERGLEPQADDRSGGLIVPGP